MKGFVKHTFIDCKVDNVLQYVELATLLEGYLFRGQSANYNSLSTSLERLIDQEDKSKAEGIALKLFKARAHHFISYPPDLNDDIEWLALLQHHGGPTRLVDVTKSIFVATYFAIMSSKKENSDALIWTFPEQSINNLFNDECQQKAETCFPIPVDLMDKVQEEILLNNIIGTQDGKGRYSADLRIAIITPRRINERMVAQQAKFIAPLLSTNAFMKSFLFSMGIQTKEDLKSLNYDLAQLFQDIRRYSHLVIKLHIPKDIFPLMIKLLDKMNINEATLFPGLDGFARSLYHYFENSNDKQSSSEIDKRDWKYFDELIRKTNNEQ